MKKKYFVLLFCFCCSFQILAQETIRPGKTYKEGSELAAPKSGINFKVPLGWSGYVLLDSDFLTIYLDSLHGVQAMYFARQATLKQIAKNWQKGAEIAPGVRLELSDKPSFANGVLYAPVHLTNSSQSRGFIFSKCGQFGNCASVLVSFPGKYFSKLNGNVGSLINNVSFVKPYYPDPNEFVNWKKLLTGSYLFNYEEMEGSKNDSKVWLYYNGTFKSKVKQSGVFKGKAGKYKGTQKGTYWISNDEEGNGAYLTLYFKKLPELKLKLERDDAHYYINERKFYFQKIENY
ncbi:MAG: hypothetical protein JXR07_08920 [Reichenbachiella sp.]